MVVSCSWRFNMNLGKETETLEFKKTTAELRNAMESISAILNKHGVGTLYFGVKPNGTVCGQEVSESSLRDVSRLIYESIKPQIYPVIEEVIIDNKHLIKVEFSGDDTPYSAFGRYFLRTADEDREVTPGELKSFFVANEYKEKWEKNISSVSAKDFDKSAVKSFIDNSISAGRMPKGKYKSSDILNRFGLANKEYLTNAGEILFGNSHPVTLKVAIFATNEKLTFLDMKLYEDNVFNLLSIAEDYIFKNIRWKSEIINMRRVEIPEIPVAVIREVLANSFAHAIYNSNTYHEICIYPDKITIYSPGAYASCYKPEEYAKKFLQSVIRNATIAKILYLNKSIEQFGSGFKRINSLCKDAGIKYSYEASELGFTFIIHRKNINNTTTVSTKNKLLNQTEQLVLELLKIHPNYTRNQLSEEVSKTVRTIQRTLDSLRDKGFIIREGSNKDGFWKIIKK